MARPGSFAVLLPVKSPGTGKSRLSALSDVDRARLAAAFARDAVRAEDSLARLVEAQVVAKCTARDLPRVLAGTERALAEGGTVSSRAVSTARSRERPYSSSRRPWPTCSSMPTPATSWSD